VTDDPNAPANNRANAGKFVPGRSANPAGKKRGTKNRRTIIAEKLLAGVDVAAILAKLERQAKKGDTAAARLILDRALPARRGLPIAIKLPAIKTAQDCVAAMSVVMGALAAGRISTIEASELSNVIDATRRTIETIDLETRLAAIEALMRSDPDERKL
jgi:Family of unknown function (DUF5681)